jgi:RNA polymerase sigma-70 factor, ECF subfamily
VNPSLEPPTLASPGPDWNSVVEQALSGDRSAYARLARLVTGHLAHWRAYDFRPEWDDIVQDVLISVVNAYREGRLDAPGALAAYLRQATRFKFIDCIRASGRRASKSDPMDEIESGDQGLHWPPLRSVATDAQEIRIELEAALAALPERERIAVCEIHVRGRTYEEAASVSGIPLGSLKRALREGLDRLRNKLDASN